MLKSYKFFRHCTRVDMKGKQLMIFVFIPILNWQVNVICFKKLTKNLYFVQKYVSLNRLNFMHKNSGLFNQKEKIIEELFHFK